MSTPSAATPADVPLDRQELRATVEPGPDREGSPADPEDHDTDEDEDWDEQEPADEAEDEDEETWGDPEPDDAWDVVADLR